MAETISLPKKTEKERHTPILDASRVRGAEFERVIYCVFPDKGVTQEDMQDPAFWSSTAVKFRPWTRLEVYAEDGTYFAEAIVLACDRAWAKVHFLSWHNLTTSDVSLTQAQTSKFEVTHTPNRKWHVVRKADRQIMKEFCQTKGEAETWLTEYTKTVPA